MFFHSLGRKTCFGPWGLLFSPGEGGHHLGPVKKKTARASLLGFFFALPSVKKGGPAVRNNYFLTSLVCFLPEVDSCTSIYSSFSFGEHGACGSSDGSLTRTLFRIDIKQNKTKTLENSKKTTPSKFLSTQPGSSRQRREVYNFLPWLAISSGCLRTLFYY